MKKLLKLLKYLNALTNNELTAKEEAEQIFKFLILKNSTVKSIEVWEALEIEMAFEMDKRLKEANYISRAVSLKWPVKTVVYDPIFDKSLSKIETNFEIVKPK